MAQITATLDDGYRVPTRARTHEWVADEPENVGGDDAGPTPYELLLGSLAACTVMTIKMYCERKGWPLGGVSATFGHDRVHADDCAECESDRTGYLDRITSDIRIDGDFDDAQRARLQQVAVRCPVHKTLERSVVFSDTVTVA